MSRDPEWSLIGGRFTVLRTLGRGASSTVFLARESLSERLVAVKRYDGVATTPDVTERLMREFRTLRGLNHPSIVGTFDYFIDGEAAVLVQEYFDGGSLASLLKGRNSLPLGETIAIIQQIADALDYAHHRGIVHNDVKPSNVLIRKDGRVALVDFGIARPLHSRSLTEIGTVRGTPEYMSPEQVMGVMVDERSDIYGLGVLTYELLAGHPPFVGDTPMKVISQQISASAVPLAVGNPAIPQAISHAVERALAKPREERFGSAGEFAGALRAGLPRQPAPHSEPASLLFEAKLRRLRFSIEPFFLTLLLAGAIAVVVGLFTAAPEVNVRTALLAVGPLVVLGSVVGLLRSRRAGSAPAPVINFPDDRTEVRGRPVRQDVTMEVLPYPEATLIRPVVGEPGGLAWLLILSGPRRGERVRLVRVSTIGRDPVAQVFLNDREVSRHHAEIAVDGGRFFIRDLRSTNSTYVNGQPIRERLELHDRDELRIGDTIMSFVQALGPGDLNPESQARVQEFDTIWEELVKTQSVIDTGRFTEWSERLVAGPLRQAIGYSIEARVPYFHAIVGFVVNAPMLWIRRSRFPLLMIAFDRRRPDVLADVVKQLEMAKTSEFFALLVVIPTPEGTGNEAEELKHIVQNSVYRHDFVVLDRAHLMSIVAQNSSRRLVEIILDQGIELSSLSPYVALGPVPENMFFGRESEVKLIRQALDGGNYAIVGARRIGKSSVLQQLARLLADDPRFHCVYLDCEAQFGYADFVRSVYEKFDEEPSSLELSRFRDLVTAVNRRTGGTRLVFLLDEVDELLALDSQATPSGQLFKIFRALANENAARFVFSGSRTLFEHLHDPASPFFNFSNNLELTVLTAPIVAELVTKPMYQLGIQLVEDGAVVQRIVDATSCHPSLVQWLCDRLVRSAHNRCVRADDVDSAVADAAFEQRFVETAWGSASPFEKLLSLIPEGSHFTASEVEVRLAGYGVSDRLAIRDGLRILEMSSVIRRESDGYAFVLARFPQVVRHAEDVDSLIQSLLSSVGS